MCWVIFGVPIWIVKVRRVDARRRVNEMQLAVALRRQVLRVL